LYQKFDLDCAAALHATAPSEAQHLRELQLKPPIVCIANGIKPPPNSALIERENKLKLQRSGTMPRTALFLSRFHPKKGLPMLVEAWKRICPQGWRMVAVGPDEGDHRNAVKRLVQQAGIGKCWEFHDAVQGECKWRLLASADLFILPTHSENFGNVVAESLIAGTPVITTTGAPWSGLLRHRCGWWVNPCIDSLSSALEEATALPSETLLAMGSRGKSWASREFAWPAIAARMAAVYEAILSGKRTDDFIA
jgi:glycosyltransferase involved in cell wall biosynthesis